jgi:SAM-dependent methyltransferase
MTDAPTPNRNQAALWNDTAGRTWANMQALLDRILAPFAEPVWTAGFPGEGRRVLDIGCGAGATTLGMARRLGPDGFCLGVDISEPLVAAAKAGAEAEAVGSAHFIQADAQTFEFDPGGFDAVISRFGVMFFDDPEAAFANIRRAARPGAKLAFLAWRGPAENPFMTTAARAAAPYVPPIAPPQPGAPGQFGFADGDRVRRILAASGWSDIDVSPLDVPTEIAEPDLVSYVTRMGPAGLALQAMEEGARAEAAKAIRAAFDPFVQDGAARFTGACWLGTARA